MSKLIVKGYIYSPLKEPDTKIDMDYYDGKQFPIKVTRPDDLPGEMEIGLATLEKASDGLYMECDIYDQVTFSIVLFMAQSGNGKLKASFGLDKNGIRNYIYFDKHCLYDLDTIETREE